MARQLTSHPRQSSINHQDDTGTTALMWAVTKGHKEVFTELLQQEDIDLHLGEGHGRKTALHLAIEYCREGMARKLASHPRQSSLNSMEGNGSTALIWAVEKGNEEVLTELLQQKDCDISLKNWRTKRTALHIACRDGRVEMVRQLASHPRQGSLNSKDCQGTNALMMAVTEGHKEVVTELLQLEDCDINLEDNAKRTALHLACINGRVGMVRQLASHPRQSSLNSKDNWGRTAIMYAVEKGHKEVFTELLQLENCDINLEDRDKRTAMHRACMYGRVGMVTQLASNPRQSSLNSKDDEGRTAIMMAVMEGEAECVLALINVAGVERDTRSLEELRIRYFAPGIR